MKALSLKEPWASMVYEGKKTIETRKWKTDYRGDILFCASKKPVSPLSGKAFAIVNLYHIEPMTKEDEKAACCEIYPGAYSWILRNIRPLKYLFPMRGSLSLFEFNMDLYMKMKIDELTHKLQGVLDEINKN